MTPDLGDEVSLLNGENIYEVISTTSRHWLLRCVSFYAEEDLGDGIMCTRGQQAIWISMYFAHRFRKR